MNKCLVAGMVVFSYFFVTAQAVVTFKCSSILAFQVVVARMDEKKQWVVSRKISPIIRCESRWWILQNPQLTAEEIAVGGKIGIACPFLGVQLVLNDYSAKDDGVTYDITNNVAGQRYSIEMHKDGKVLPVNYISVSSKKKNKSQREK